MMPSPMLRYRKLLVPLIRRVNLLVLYLKRVVVKEQRGRDSSSQCQSNIECLMNDRSLFRLYQHIDYQIHRLGGAFMVTPVSHFNSHSSLVPTPLSMDERMNEKKKRHL
jgi:hypothetical protein